VARLLSVRLAEPAIAAPGQGCVLYDGDRVLGGGFIRRTARGEAQAAAGAVDSSGKAA
jgi:tRNA-specific 2-thiouridylase